MKKMMMTAALMLIGTVAMNARSNASALFGNGVGINVGYSGFNENAGFGVHGRINLTEGFRIEPTFNYYFKKDEQSQWDIMANFHYVFPVAGKIGLYPLVGIGVASYKYSGVKDSESKTGFSMNFGGGIEFPVSSDFSLGFELKGQYIGIDHWLPENDNVKFVPTFKATYIF